MAEFEKAHYALLNGNETLGIDAVTDDAVRNQTQRSADVIQRSTEQTHSSVETTDAAGEALPRIVDAVATINDLNGQIATASDKQANVAGEIDQRIISITDLAKTTSSEAESNPDEINNIVTEIQRLNEKFSTIRA